MGGRSASSGMGGGSPFPNSVVRNTVFHGTDATFDVFDKSHIGENFAISDGGIFFTNDENQAGRYGHNVKEVYLNMENPLIVESPGLVSPIDFYDSQDLRGEAMAMGNDGVIVRGTGDYSKKQAYIVFEPDQIKVKSNRVSKWR